MFVFRHPKSVPPNTFLLPFKSTIWYGIVGLTLLSACIIRNIFSVENHKKVKQMIKDGSTNDDSYSNSILMVFGFILQQSGIWRLISTYKYKFLIFLRLFRESFPYIISNIGHRSTNIFVADISILFFLHCWFIIN